MQHHTRNAIGNLTADIQIGDAWFQGTAAGGIRSWHTKGCLSVQVIVITGDNKLTAEAICRKVGVFAVDDDLQGKSITGVEFAKLSAEERKAFLDTTEGACFSRAEPKHKQVSPPLLLSWNPACSIYRSSVVLETASCCSLLLVFAQLPLVATGAGAVFVLQLHASDLCASPYAPSCIQLFRLTDIFYLHMDPRYASMRTDSQHFTALDHVSLVCSYECHCLVCAGYCAPTEGNAADCGHDGRWGE